MTNSTDLMTELLRQLKEAVVVRVPLQEQLLYGFFALGLDLVRVAHQVVPRGGVVVLRVVRR